MSLAQKFQNLRNSGPALALTGLLTLSSMLPFSNAQAQEPAVKHAPSAPVTLAAHHTTEPVFKRAESPYESAMPDAENENRIAFWIVLPQGAPVTPEDAGVALVNEIGKLGVPAQSFGRNSPKGSKMTVNIYTPDGIYTNPVTKTGDFDLRSVFPQLKIVAEKYLSLQHAPRVAIKTPESAP